MEVDFIQVLLEAVPLAPLLTTSVHIVSQTNGGVKRGIRGKRDHSHNGLWISQALGLSRMTTTTYWADKVGS